MKIKTSITLFTLLSIGCILLLQQQLEVQDSNFQILPQITADVCADVGGKPSSSEKSEAKRIRDQLLNTNKRIPFDVVVKTDRNDEENKEIQSATVSMSLPWLILLVLSWLSYIVLSFCCCDCCTCHCCACEKAQKVDHIRISLTFSILFSLIILGFCIAGLVLSEKVGESLKEVRCSAIKIFSDIDSGVTDSDNLEYLRWKGLNSVAQNLTNIQNSLNQLIQNTQDQLDDIDPQQLNDQYKELLQENNKLEQVVMADSYYFTQNIFGYIANSKSIPDTRIVAEVTETKIAPQNKLFQTIYENIIAQISSIKTNGQGITQDQTTISNSLIETQAQVKDLQANVNRQALQFEEDTKTFDDVSKITNLFFYIIYGVFALFALIVLLGSTTICFNKGLSLCKCLTVFSCVIYFFFLIIGFILCALFAVSSGVLAESCDYLDQILTNQTKFFEMTVVVKDGEIKNIMNECLFGAGDILNYYKVYDKLSQVTGLDNSIKEFTASQQAFTTATQQGDAALTINSDYIESFKTFQRVDSQEYTNPDPTNIKYIMREQVKQCGNNKKSSVPDKMTYCDTTAYQYEALKGNTFSNPNNKPVCLQSAIFSADSNLLNQQIQDCPDIQTINAKYLSQSIQWEQALITQNNTRNKHKQNQNALEDKFTKVNSYTTAASQFLNSITDKENGALAGVNCLFVQASLQRVQDSMCAGTFRFIYYHWIFFAIISISFLLSIFSIFRISIGIHYIRQSEKYVVEGEVNIVVYPQITQYQPAPVDQNVSGGYVYQPAQAIVYTDIQNQIIKQ